MIPKRYAPLLFGLILSSMMSLLVSGIATIRATGPTAAFMDSWLRSWLAAWVIAFPTVLVLAPLTRRFVDRITSMK